MSASMQKSMTFGGIAARASLPMHRLGAGSPLIRHLHASSIVQSDTEQDLMSRIKDQLKQAMRAKDNFSSTVYRSLLSEQQYAAKAGGGSDTASQMSTILQKALAKRQDSSRQFRAANPAREDLAEKEDREADIIRSFLPEQISAQELDDLVRKAVEEAKQAGIVGKRMMGQVMKSVSSQVDRSRAPGSMISEAVKKALP